jgi:hypothetical protein
MRGSAALLVWRRFAREDVGQPLDVDLVEDAPAARALEARDQLGAQDVDLPVQDAPLERDLALLGAEIVDQKLELLVWERAEIRKWFQLEQTFRR